MITTEQELQLIEDYKNGMKTKEIEKKYGTYDYRMILEKHGVELKNGKNRKWTPEKIEKLREIYPEGSWDEILEAFPEFDKGSIKSKTSALKIPKISFGFTKEDEEIFRVHYSSMSTKDFIEKFFPNKSESSIHSKAYKMGIGNRIRWTEEENKILMEHYPNRKNRYLKEKFFPNRTLSAIMCQGMNLGLKKDVTNTQYEKEELLEALKKFAEELGRTPNRFDFLEQDNSIPAFSTYFRYFGSYTEACIQADIVPNDPFILGEFQIPRVASDGTLCFSNSELIITEYLIKNKMNFEKEIHYKDFCDDSRCGKLRSDWVLNDGTVIEYFGMMKLRGYRENSEMKQKICKENGINLISLYPEDIKRLDQLLKPLTNESP